MNVVIVDRNEAVTAWLKNIKLNVIENEEAAVRILHVRVCLTAQTREPAGLYKQSLRQTCETRPHPIKNELYRIFVVTRN